jgi:excisionase family DNA binding protein
MVSARLQGGITTTTGAINMEFYTLRDVSEMLHVSMTTIYRYVKEGRLTPAKIGNSYRVTEADLQEFIDRGKAATRAARAEKAVSSGSATRVSPSARETTATTSETAPTATEPSALIMKSEPEDKV